MDLEDSFSTDNVAGMDQAFLDDLIISGVVVMGPSLDIIGYASCTGQLLFRICLDCSPLVMAL